MKPTFTATFAVLLVLCFFSCTKETPVSTQAILSSSGSVDQSIKKTGTIVGRQKVIDISTGDYYQPTAQALLWLPDSYNAKWNKNKHYPLIIALGGIGQNGSSNIDVLLSSHTIASRISDGWDASATNPVNKALYKFIVFSPLNSASGSWGWSAPAIKTMLKELEEKYRVADSRVYITGLSAGGWGLWSCITDDNNLCKQFAAIGPVSSAGADHPDKISNVDKYGIAYWNICGTLDAFYPLAVSYTATININKPLITPVLTSLLGVGHSAWDQAYNPAWKQDGISFYQWLLQYKRKDTKNNDDDHE